VDEAEGVGLELRGHAVEADIVHQGEQGAGVVGVDEEGLVEVEDEAVGVGDGDLVEVMVVAVEPGAPEEEVDEEGVEEGAGGLEVGEEGVVGEAVQVGDEGGEVGGGAEAVFEGAAGGALFALWGDGAAGQTSVAAGGFGCFV
jgi:hypothetical protein